MTGLPQWENRGQPFSGRVPLDEASGIVFDPRSADPSQVKSHDFICDDIKVSVTLFDDDDIQRLDEAIHKGNPLFGPYSYQQHPGQPPHIQRHLHLYRRNNQLFSINQDGTGHDGYHGFPIPGRVADELRRRFPTWNIPDNNIIESVSSVHYYVEIMRHSEGR